jgi:GT2 family glycosyltransferase
MSQPFTAARARNVGLDAALETGATPGFVQFVDADCELQPGWLETALAHMVAHPRTAVVCGRRRERFPDASLWNRMIDAEWDTPIGPAKACGGDALMRLEAFQAVGGFNPALIAAEEPELCVRLRQAGWEIYRIDAEMTLHDAAMTRFGQWWQRARRAGHAYAEGAALHGSPPERHKVPEIRRAILWGLVLPVTILLGALFVSPWTLMMVLLYPLQMLRLALKGYSAPEAVFLTLAKLPEARGALQYWLTRLRGEKAALIEYK